MSKAEFDYFQKKKEEEQLRRKEEEQNKGKKKDTKKPAEEKAPDFSKETQLDVPMEEVVPEPASKLKEQSQKSLHLKFTGVADSARYEVDSRSIHFLPTMMFTSRTHTFSLKNTSLIKMHYRCKVVSSVDGTLDMGYYAIAPKTGCIEPGCQESITVRFSPTECENNERLLVVSIENLAPE